LGEPDVHDRRWNAETCLCMPFMHEQKRYADDAEAASDEPARQLMNETVEREDQRFDILDRCRQLELSLVARGRNERQSCIGDEAARTIERIDQCLPDSSC